MSEQVREQARQRLATLIREALEDHTIDQRERDELQALYRSAVLTVNDVKGVLLAEMRSLQEEILADGRVTDAERERCRQVVTALRIPHGLLTQEIKVILRIP